MKLVEYRKKNNKTQKEMAAFFGVSLIVYCSWEYGKRMPRIKNMFMIEHKTNNEVNRNDFYEAENEED